MGKLNGHPNGYVHPEMFNALIHIEAFSAAVEDYNRRKMELLAAEERMHAARARMTDFDARVLKQLAEQQEKRHDHHAPSQH